MRTTRKWLIIISILIVLALAVSVVFLNRDFFAHYFKSYEIIPRVKLTEWYSWEYDGLMVFYAEGHLHNRNLWINENDWDFPNYAPQKVNDKQEAIAVATYIKNNSDYTKRYNVTDYVIRSVWYDTQYNVWCVTFDPPDAARGPDMYTLDASIGIIFRGYNGKILYIGPC